jgi:hypothetical protein
LRFVNLGVANHSQRMENYNKRLTVLERAIARIRLGGVSVSLDDIEDEIRKMKRESKEIDDELAIKEAERNRVLEKERIEAEKRFLAAEAEKKRLREEEEKRKREEERRIREEERLKLEEEQRVKQAEIDRKKREEEERRKKIEVFFISYK